MVILFFLFLPIPLNDFAAILIAAVVIRQPYSPAIGHNVSVGAVGLSHRGSRKQKSPFFIKPIQFPFFRIMLDILRNVVHFRPIPNYMVMETRLPCKRNVVFVGVFGDSGFVLSNDTRQSPATIGTALHFFVFI